MPVHRAGRKPIASSGGEESGKVGPDAALLDELRQVLARVEHEKTEVDPDAALLDELRQVLAHVEHEKAEAEAEKMWLEEQAAKGVPRAAAAASCRDLIYDIDNCQMDIFRFVSDSNVSTLSVWPHGSSKQPEATNGCVDIEGGSIRAELEMTNSMLEQLVLKVERLCKVDHEGRKHTVSSAFGSGHSTNTLVDGLADRADSEMNEDENEEMLTHSAVAMAPPVQALVYLAAFSGIVFTLLYPALEKRRGSRGPMGAEEAQERRLGGPAGGVIVAVCYSTLGAGIMAMISSFLKQPILVGYILGGVLVGPVGLGLVDNYNEILAIMDLGLVLLLFMIGLEVDMHALLHMDNTSHLTGFLQFPICVAIHLGAFFPLSLAGVSFGGGRYALGYMAFFCSISSTMIVVKSLSHKMEMDTAAGKFTMGILLIQDFWAFLCIATQANVQDPDIINMLKDFGFMGVLIYVSFSYSKYVLPPIFQLASRSTELMLVLALAWCFFICSVANLPFINLSVEVAAFIGGVSMATFPYNAELNCKIKYVRDYFITLYFVGIGMQMNTPTASMAVSLMAVCSVVLVARWFSIFLVTACLGSGHRVAILSTVNLSQCSEFGLVLCTLGLKLGHIDEEGMSLAIWAFALLAMAASYLIGYNHSVYHAVMHMARSLPCARLKRHLVSDSNDEDAEERDIVILGFHKIAAALIPEFETKAPQIIKRIHVIDHKMFLGRQLAKKGIAFSAIDITSADLLREVQKGRVDLVLVTIPDYIITGVSNARLLTIAREVWPMCHIIVIADDPKQIKRLYNKGANYVLATKKLSAERIADMLTEHYDGLGGGELKGHLELRRRQESEWRATLVDLGVVPGACK